MLGLYAWVDEEDGGEDTDEEEMEEAEHADHSSYLASMKSSEDARKAAERTEKRRLQREEEEYPAQRASVIAFLHNPRKFAGRSLGQAKAPPMSVLIRCAEREGAKLTDVDGALDSDEPLASITALLKELLREGTIFLFVFGTPTPLC